VPALDLSEKITIAIIELLAEDEGSGQGLDLRGFGCPAWGWTDRQSRYGNGANARPGFLSRSQGPVRRLGLELAALLVHAESKSLWLAATRQCRKRAPRLLQAAAFLE